MPVFRHTLFALATAAGLALITTFAMSPGTAAQSAGPHVTIAGPLTLPVDDSSETVLALDETLEVSPGNPGGTRLGPIDVSRFRQVRVATRLVEGGAADVAVRAYVLMGTTLLQTAAISPPINLNESVVVDLPGQSLVIGLSAQNPTTAHVTVYGRR